MIQEPPVSPTPQSSPDIAEKNYRSRLKLGFSLFSLFFVLYMGVAIIQTPTFKSVAGIPVFGLPLGMLLSLMIFPVSFILIAVYFILWR